MLIPEPSRNGRTHHPPLAAEVLLCPELRARRWGFLWLKIPTFLEGNPGVVNRFFIVE